MMQAWLDSFESWSDAEEKLYKGYELGLVSQTVLSRGWLTDIPLLGDLPGHTS